MGAPTELLSEQACFGGSQRFYRHASREIGLPMRFSVFLPPQAEHGTVPAVLFLAGLTCNEETFMTKAGAQRMAAHLGLALIAPDTSPRGANAPGEADNWDFGVGAGFYIDATQAPWATHWRMESYLMAELLPLLTSTLPIDGGHLGVFGHSMGGHGALTLALKHPGVFKSVSAFAPICAPTQCAWGHKAFAGYLGADPTRWAAHDEEYLTPGEAQRERGAVRRRGDRLPGHVPRATERPLVRLETGWDGYRGRPVSLEIALFTLRLLEAIYSPDQRRDGNANE